MTRFARVTAVLVFAAGRASAQGAPPPTPLPPPATPPPAGSAVPAGGPSTAAPGSPPPPAQPLAPPPPAGGAPYGGSGYPPGSYPPGSYPPPQYPPPYGYPPPGYGYAPPGYAYAPPPAPRRDIHNHDGFFFRMGIGAGSAPLKLSTPGFADTTIKGSGVAINFAVGGAVVDGLILAADLSGVNVTSPTVDSGGGTVVTGSATKASYSSLLFLVDWFPNPKGGFHVQGGLGVADYTFSVANIASRSLSGLGWSLGGGFEGWVGEQWSIGGLLRLDGASVKSSDSNVNADLSGSVLSPKILFTATFM